MVAIDVVFEGAVVEEVRSVVPKEVFLPIPKICEERRVNIRVAHEATCASDDQGWFKSGNDRLRSRFRKTPLRFSVLGGAQSF